MKLIIFILFFLFTLNSAQANQAKNEMMDYYSCPTNTYVCNTLIKNMNNDSDKCMVAPKSITLLKPYWEQNSTTNIINVGGMLRYFGPIAGEYYYQLSKKSGNKIKVVVPVYFENLKLYNANEIQNYENKFKIASQIWNQNNPYSDFYEFYFILQKTVHPMVLSTKLIRQDTRGPYFNQWSLQWSPQTIAHEFGHVMGLLDEYDYLSQSQSKCDLASSMCSTYGKPQEYHYHIVLQRAFCEV